MRRMGVGAILAVLVPCSNNIAADSIPFYCTVRTEIGFSIIAKRDLRKEIQPIPETPTK
jgi:hypothetical protein